MDYKILVAEDDILPGAAAVWRAVWNVKKNPENEQNFLKTYLKFFIFLLI